MTMTVRGSLPLAAVLLFTSFSVLVAGRGAFKLQNLDYKKFSQSVMAGARMGVAECDRQFKLEPWNCILSKRNRLLPVFNKATLPLANRETAFVHAITMAGAMYSVIRNCSLGQLENCKCQKSANFKKARSSSSSWHWGGCSDNMAFGDLITRHFIDALEGRKGAGFEGRRQMNLHNNKVGRKVVKLKTKMVCKCHGASSSCAAKTCTKKLGSFEDVGAALKEKYKKAIHVQFKNKTLYDDKDKVARKGRLSYFDKSPDYCKPNKHLNIPGVEGRVCEGTKESLKRCEKLCTSCGLRIRTKLTVRHTKCNCKFVWCCHVKCERCVEDVLTVTCVR